MSSLAETIAENSRAARRFFDVREWPEIDHACTEAGADNLPMWERRSAALRIAKAYERVAGITYNGQERAEALAAAATWHTIHAHLST
jgi:hypothetical protein